MHPDITFDSLLISRKHCCIEQRGEGWSICELKSKHGTLLNGGTAAPVLIRPAQARG